MLHNFINNWFISILHQEIYNMQTRLKQLVDVSAEKNGSRPRHETHKLTEH